jgi:hypothetical protein
MFKGLLTGVDKFYFYLRDHLKGAKQGFNDCYDSGYTTGYGNGYEDGALEMIAEISKELVERNPNISDSGFQLGYNHAIAVVKGEL